MKKLLFIITVACIAGLMSACQSPGDPAMDYNHAIIREQLSINSCMERLFDSFKDHKPVKMDSAYSEALSQLRTGTDSVSKMDAFDGKTELRDAALKLFMVYDTVLNNEFKEMIALLKLPDDQYTRESEDRCNLLKDQIMKKIDVAFARLTRAQENFAKENELDLESSNIKGGI